MYVPAIVLSTLLLVSSAAAQLFGNGAATSGGVPDPNKAVRHLNISTSVDFFDAAAALGGVKLVNGEYTTVNVKVANMEERSIVVEYVGASLFDPVKVQTVKNYTSVRIGKVVAKDAKLDLPYRFMGDVPERDDLHLQIALVLTTGDGQVVTSRRTTPP